VSEGPSRKVFLSVAGPDAAWGDRIDQRLRDAGLEVAYYRRSFPQGTNFIKEINSALASCDCMVALLSPAYCNPGSWVTEEWQAALRIVRERPGFLVPFLIEQCQLPPLLGPLSDVNLTHLNEEDAGSRLLEKLQDRDWTRPALSGARGPAESTWVAAVHRSESGRLPMGTGVVIDERRVLTSAHVVTENGKVMDPLPWVAFPMAHPSGQQRREVVGVRLSDDVSELAMLDLSEDVPAGVKAAPLRRPRPEHLTGRGWWAYGFPGQEASGSHEDAEKYGGQAEGEVNSVRAHGVLELNADSRRAVQAGFSGAGLWSPDYDAVVGIVSRVDSRGTGQAVSLHQADLCFGGDRLSTLMGWSAEQAGEGAIQAWGWAPQKGGYRFQGRGAALAEIAGWLDRDRPEFRALVVTGSPGAGKSAVLGRIVTTADPRLRARLPPDDRAVRATEGSVACAVHAKGKTALEVATEIARAFSVELPSLTGQLDNLAPAVSKAVAEQGPGRLNLVIDALDEASRPADTRSIVTQIVRPLLRAGAQVVVGSRRRDDAGDILPAFRNAVAVIDLDAPKYYSPQDVEAYALATLQQGGAEQRPGNPYADEAVARPLAVRIAELSRGNFLVAGLTAQSHAESDREPADPGELAAYSEDAEDALYEALQRALNRGGPEAAGMSVTTALTALTALAFCEAPGLSCELWGVAVESLPGEPLPARLQDTQLAGFARSTAGSFLVESSGQDDKAVFGLFHQALNDALLYRRAQRTTSVTGDAIKEDQQALTRALLHYGRDAGWASAPPYLLRSLAHHAELAGLIDELLADDEYLLYADLQRLTPLAAQARTEAGQERARLLRLTPYAVPAGPHSRRALFSVTETLEKLGGSFRADPGPAPYRARWSTATTHLERAAQSGHTGGVVEVCAYASAGGAFLASAGEDEMVRVWDPAAGEQLRVLEGHSGRLNGVCAFTSGDDRTLLASAGADAMVRVWDPATGEQLRVLEGRTGVVNGVCALTADGRRLLASAGADGTVAVWDPATGEQLRVLEGHTGAVNRVCAFASGDDRTLLGSAGADGTVRVWDPATGEQLRVLEGHTGVVRGVCAFTADGRRLLGSAGADGTVRVWDPATGERRRVLEGHVAGVWQVSGFTSGDGRTLLASASDDETVRVWDPATGEQRYVMEGHTGGGWTVCAFASGDGRTLLASAGADPEVRVWDPVTGEQQVLEGHPGSVWSVCGFAAGDGRTLLAAAGDDETVRVWDPATGQQQHAMEGHTGGAWSVCAFTAGDGRALLAAASHDGVVRVWEPDTGQLRQAFACRTDEVWSVCAFTSGGGTLLATAGNDSVVRVWDPATGEFQRAMEGHAGIVWWLCALASGDGRTLLASAAADETVRVWDPVTGERLQALRGHTGGAWSVCAFASDDGRTLLASVGADSKVRVWDPVTGELLKVLEGHTAGVWSVCAFTVGGRTLLASCAEDAVARVWDPMTAQTLEVIPLHLAPHVVWEVAGRLVVGLSAGLLTIELNPAGHREGDHL
jgi:WD40 repeat protein